jgi:hypothetical protein
VELCLADCIVTFESDLKRNPISAIGWVIRTDYLPLTYPASPNLHLRGIRVNILRNVDNYLPVEAA